MEKTNREDEEEDNDYEKKNMLTHLDKSVVLGSWHTTMYYQHYIVLLTSLNTVIQISWQIQSIIWSFHLVELHLQFNVLDSSR